ncbi:symmetrical bis(5'-nucleosyl)-tetraphosphatase [Lujinxingia vulgaris]|uniref:bis(5'-nucleosyl)-tetraphosphatase (symmetrical) n=1 Tax=Lujinxingia vulgaris TaxID=2600176 RepID=A0A5C6XI76_9DELT|nr:symmetrical bis(5'-nucleosyl)-tetraphosphatase [Lujinxingia vulgaris]TXD37235.1 symmetrical bis(5'-nucleosyl)-tetraphosphatase [Lujinxingia vulgaris]
MATIVVGDVHGCLRELKQVLARADFEPGRDRVVFVGDLVNGGPDSLGVMRFVRGLGDGAEVVLGNHDLHMLAVGLGGHKPRDKDTFEDVLSAPDADELLEWLRHRPMIVRRGENLVVHAGLWPSWTASQAEAVAREVEGALRADDYRRVFEAMYGNEPRQWHEDLEGEARLRVAINIMTRMRVLEGDGSLEFDYKSTYEAIEAPRHAWFDAEPARWAIDGAQPGGVRVICGHWSALGYMKTPRLLALDTGCVWGRALSAVRLEDGHLFQVNRGGLDL